MTAVPGLGGELPRVLFVDDEMSVLSAMRRAMHGAVAVLTATGGEEALAVVASTPDLAVVVCDMRMPGLDGAETLAAIRRSAPDVVRILLTGHAELDAAVAAVNQGQVFRFLTKPADRSVLLGALSTAVEQHRLRRAERELTEGTVHGLISVLMDVLAAVNPAAHAASSRVAGLARRLAELAGVDDPWEAEVAARLSSLGGIAVPEEVLRRAAMGDPLEPDEQAAVDDVPALGADLLARIPRLERVAAMVRHHHGTGDLEQLDAPTALGAGVLRLAVALDRARQTTGTLDAARHVVLAQEGHHPAAIAALRAGLDGISGESAPQRVPLRQLVEGMTINEDLHDARGNLLLAEGHVISRALKSRIRRFIELYELPHDIEVV